MNADDGTIVKVWKWGSLPQQRSALYRRAKPPSRAPSNSESRTLRRCFPISANVEYRIFSGFLCCSGVTEQGLAGRVTHVPSRLVRSNFNFCDSVDRILDPSRDRIHGLFFHSNESMPVLRCAHVARGICAAVDHHFLLDWSVLQSAQYGRHFCGTTLICLRPTTLPECK